LHRWAELFARPGDDVPVRSGSRQGFVQVEVVPERAPERGGGDPRCGLLYVVTRSGHEVRMANGLDRETLAMVLEVLGAC